MRPGEYRNRITIQRQTENRGEDGSVSYGWETFATVWAKVMIKSGKEYWASAKINAELSGIIKCRYLSGVLPSMRIVYGSRTFEILAVIDIEERHRELEIQVKEVVE